MKTLIQLILSVVILFFFVSCSETTAPSGQSDESTTEQESGQAFVDDDESAKNILQVAVGSKDHSTLVAAVQAAELENVLVNAGPLTVFAPNNAAFDKLPEGTVGELVKPENKSTLSRIIKYHASPGNYQIDMLKDGQSLFQASGHYIKITKKDDEVMIGDAKILGTVQASNGVIHVIDGVLLPPEN
ncbi:MAG: fasciclin domain-containing protein [Chitinophagales bacterium]|nr:fasciclin domain-containing protein [Chitinophagales bacterium]